VQLKTHTQQKCNFFEMYEYFITIISTVTQKGCPHYWYKVYKIPKPKFNFANRQVAIHSFANETWIFSKITTGLYLLKFLAII